MLNVLAGDAAMMITVCLATFTTHYLATHKRAGKSK